MVHIVFGPFINYIDRNSPSSFTNLLQYYNLLHKQSLLCDTVDILLPHPSHAMAQWREGLKNYLSIKWLKICCDIFSRIHLCGFLRIILKIDILNAVKALFQKFLWSKKLEKTNFLIEYYWVHYCEGNYNICCHFLHYGNMSCRSKKVENF